MSQRAAGCACASRWRGPAPPRPAPDSSAAGAAGASSPRAPRASRGGRWAGPRTSVPIRWLRLPLGHSAERDETELGRRTRMTDGLTDGGEAASEAQRGNSYAMLRQMDKRQDPATRNGRVSARRVPKPLGRPQKRSVLTHPVFYCGFFFFSSP